MDYEELIEQLRDENNCDVLDYIEDAATAIETFSAGTAIVPHIRAHVPRWRGGLQTRLWWVRFLTVRANMLWRVD